MGKNKWMEKLQKLEGAADLEVDPFNHVIKTPSPSFNFIFGNSHGLPLGYSTILWGPGKSGKSWMSYAMVAELHRSDPDAIAIRFDTEMRSTAQFTRKSAAMWGVDPDRFVIFNVNEPAFIFDRIENEIQGMIQDGAPIKLVIIDSITGIRGRRDMNATTIETQQIGDSALTLQDGFKRILPVVRRNKIALVLCAHARAEMDPIEQKRGNKYKMAAGYAVQHFAEYFIRVERNDTKEGRSDLLGNAFVDENRSDLMDRAEQTGHKVRAKMIDSTFGPKGRVGEFTIDYSKGIVNIHEEVFRLGVNRKIIQRPNNLTYLYKDQKWSGKPAALEALKNNQSLQNEIVAQLITQDRNGVIVEELTEEEAEV